MLDFNEKLSKLLDETLKTTLEQDEGIKWVGRPFKIKPLDAPFGTMLIIRWAICLALLVFAAWYSLVYVPANNTGGGWPFSLILLAVAVFIAMRPIYDVSLIQEKCVYIVTNKRAIICLLTSVPKTKSAYFSDSKEFDIDMLSPVAGNIYLGSKKNNSLSKSRDDTLFFPGPDEDPVRPLALYNVENPYDVTKYLSDSN